MSVIPNIFPIVRFLSFISQSCSFRDQFIFSAAFESDVWQSLKALVYIAMYGLYFISLTFLIIESILAFLKSYPRITDVAKLGETGTSGPKTLQHISYSLSCVYPLFWCVILEMSFVFRSELLLRKDLFAACVTNWEPQLYTLVWNRIEVPHNCELWAC